MSAPTSQADRLRTAADQLEKVMRGRFDAINPNDLPPMMREAADTIDDLCNRLRGQMGWPNAAPPVTKLVDNEHGPDMHCERCGGLVDDEYLCFMERYGYSRCPHCGRMIVKSGRGGDNGFV